nr:unnamed protein product [Digitaria exilis]
MPLPPPAMEPTAAPPTSRAAPPSHQRKPLAPAVGPSGRFPTTLDPPPPPDAPLSSPAMEPSPQRPRTGNPNPRNEEQERGRGGPTSSPAVYHHPPELEEHESSEGRRGERSLSSTETGEGEQQQNREGKSCLTAASRSSKPAGHGAIPRQPRTGNPNPVTIKRATMNWRRTYLVAGRLPPPTKVGQARMGQRRCNEEDADVRRLGADRRLPMGFAAVAAAHGIPATNKALVSVVSEDGELLPAKKLLTPVVSVDGALGLLPGKEAVAKLEASRCQVSGLALSFLPYCRHASISLVAALGGSRPSCALIHASNVEVPRRLEFVYAAN